MNDAMSGWDGILDPDERILWQGRPDGAVRWKFGHIASFIFGLFFAGFALFWMIMASRAGGGFWMFGLIHFSAGIAIAVGPPFWSAFRRRHTWYTLTDRRAFIATDLPLRGKKLTSYPIGESTVLDYDRDEPATIHFAHETVRTKNGSRRHRIGFERIGGGADVYDLFRQVQRARGKTAAGPGENRLSSDARSL